MDPTTGGRAITAWTTWQPAAMAGLAMLALAGLDLAGAFAAKETASRQSVPHAVTGAALFLALFGVYTWSLRYAELSVVTMGWIGLLQAGVLVLDHVRYDVRLSGAAWLAVAVILTAQTFLLLTVPGPAPAPASPRP